VGGKLYTQLRDLLVEALDTASGWSHSDRGRLAELVEKFASQKIRLGDKHAKEFRSQVNQLRSAGQP
jgi:hypothetical protein